MKAPFKQLGWAVSDAVLDRSNKAQPLNSSSQGGKGKIKGLEAARCTLGGFDTLELLARVEKRLVRASLPRSTPRMRMCFGGGVITSE